MIDHVIFNIRTPDNKSFDHHRTIFTKDLTEDDEEIYCNIDYEGLSALKSMDFTVNVQIYLKDTFMPMKL